MVLLTQGNGWDQNAMALEKYSSKMEAPMKEIGKMIVPMAMENESTLTGLFTKVSS